MTENEVVVLMSFLGAGVVVGVIGGWLDQLLAYIRK